MVILPQYTDPCTVLSHEPALLDPGRSNRCARPRGGGDQGRQAGLAAGYFLQRAGVGFRILEVAETVGASWQSSRDSALLSFVGADARRLVAELTA